MKTPFSFLEASSCIDTGNATDEDSVCTFKWVMFPLAASFKRPSCVHYQWSYVYFTLSVYLLTPKWVCSVTTKRVCVHFMLCASERGMCGHKSICTYRSMCLHHCIFACACMHMCGITVHTYSPFCLTWPPSPPAVRLFVLPSTGLRLGLAAQQEWLRRAWHIFSEVSFPTLLGAVWLWLGACGQGSMPGGEVGALAAAPSVRDGWTDRFQLSRTQVVPNKPRVFQPPSQTERLTELYFCSVWKWNQISDYSPGE